MKWEMGGHVRAKLDGRRVLHEVVLGEGLTLLKVLAQDDALHVIQPPHMMWVGMGSPSASATRQQLVVIAESE